MRPSIDILEQIRRLGPMRPSLVSTIVGRPCGTEMLAMVTWGLLEVDSDWRAHLTDSGLKVLDEQGSLPH